MGGRRGHRPPYASALCVIAWAAGQRPYILARAIPLGFATLEDLQALPFPTWYSLIELWFVEAHTTGLGSVAQVLDWLVNKLPEEWERMWPDPERHGMSERAQASQRLAEERYGASPR